MDFLFLETKAITTITTIIITTITTIVIIIPVLLLGASVGVTVGATVGAAVGASVGTSVGASVGSGLEVIITKKNFVRTPLLLRIIVNKVYEPKAEAVPVIAPVVVLN